MKNLKRINSEAQPLASLSTQRLANRLRSTIPDLKRQLLYALPELRIPIRLLPLIMLLAMITACDAVNTLKEGFAHSQAVSDKLERTTGLKSFVGFSWENGSLTSVNVVFKGIPPNAVLSDIAEKSSQAIAAEFKQTPKQIVISFNIEP